MMWYKWLPWRVPIRLLARRHGFLDPITFLSVFQRFAHPSEVAVPIELLRAGAVFHARGLINTKAIQQNLDWVWPFWVTQQFDPRSDSFLPRAFSITHVNLTHRNWTAVGLPDCEALPIVDPRGMVTPHFDGWSLEAWILGDNGSELLPSRAARAEQALLLEEDGLAIVSQAANAEGRELRSEARVVVVEGSVQCRITYGGGSAEPGWLAISLRPYNPEGVSFIHKIGCNAERTVWSIEGKPAVQFDQAGERALASNYHDGDVYAKRHRDDKRESISCEVGLATAAMLYRLAPGERREVTVHMPLDLREEHKGAFAPAKRPVPWSTALSSACTATIPDEQLQFLFDAAIRTLILHAPGEVYPGPYTYKRFWFRDSVYILNALLTAGLVTRVERALEAFPARQKISGFFHSQDGEWDSNGQVLWLAQRYCALTRQRLEEPWLTALRRGVHWIQRKRLSRSVRGPHAGLLPAGFSAEHLGNNDYYYWDDFWSVGGLRAAAKLFDALGMGGLAAESRREADDLMSSIEQSLAAVAETRFHNALPASPHRRMDAGAIGSIVVGYPLQLWPAREPRLLATIEFLLERCMVRGAFFQDMIHSGINAYLTMQMAQVLLRAGDARWRGLLDAVASVASPTGQWPEAIHPRTLGGCMGDGQHAWAAAEWVLLVRNMFVREEEDHLVLGAGLDPSWLQEGGSAQLGRTLTPWGALSVRFTGGGEEAVAEWEADWHETGPQLRFEAPGFTPVAVEGRTAAGAQRLTRLAKDRSGATP